MPQSNSNSSVLVRRGISIALVLVLLGTTSFFAIKHWPHSRPKTPQEQQVERDRNTVENPKASELEVSSALIRLSERREDIAKAKNIERAKSSNPEIRKNTARALGFFIDPASLKELSKLVVDPDPSVRVIAVQALGYRMGNERKSLLDGVLTRKDPLPSPQEKIEALSILVRNRTANASQRGQYTDAIFTLAQAKDSQAVSAHALTLLTSVAPKDPRLATLVSQHLTHKDRSPASALSIEEKQAEVAALHALHVVCPNNRVALLSGILSGPDKDPLLLRTVLMEIQYLKSPETTALLNKAIAKKWFPDGFRPDPHMFAERLAKSPGMDLCKGKVEPGRMPSENHGRN